MKIKSQINRATFQRIVADPKAIKGVATYQLKWDYTESRATAIYKDGFIYMKVQCKPSNKPVGTVRHTSTYARYRYEAGVPVADHVQFFLRESK